MYSNQKQIDMSVTCKNCSSKNIRSVDNQPLFHPSKDEVKQGTMRYDNEVYVNFTCDDCEDTFTKIFTLTNPR